MRFQIIGAHKESGDNIQMTVDARNQRAAEKWAKRNSIVWISILPELPEEPASDLSAPPSAKVYAAERDGVLWLIGIIAILLSLLLSDQPIGFSDAASL